QLSATSQTPAAARQTAPAFPAGCGHAMRVPSHWSTVHGLPSSVQVVPAASFVSAGQFGPAPEQTSAVSHSPAERRHRVPAVAKASAGQVAVVPSQTSAKSQALVAPRHTAPAFPGGWRQVVLAPAHTSRVQTLPAAVHGVPATLLASAGQG